MGCPSDGVESSPQGRGLFATTHWSAVLAAGHQNSAVADAALEELCRTYWYPLYAFVRQQGYRPQDAVDLTQAFFARLLEKHFLASATPERGKFRWFLLASLRHFLLNEWHRAHTKKRGGGLTFVPLHELAAESRFRAEPVTEMDAEKLYERRWALILLEMVRARLREKMDAAGKADRFDLLMELLPGGQTDLTYAEVGRRLGVTEGAVKSEVCRFRRHYLETLRAEIAHTVSSPVEIEEEIRALIRAVSG
jgi:DNA-directed RNA polymerase specialized sigma24 family protein